MVVVKLTVAIATLFSRVDCALQVARQLQAQDVDEIVIVVQAVERPVDVLIKPNGWPARTKIIVDKGQGISRSRNIGLMESSSDYLWIVDDDVEFVPGACGRAKHHLRLHAGSICLARIGFSDEPGQYTRLRPAGRLGKIHLCRANSIELMLPRGRILDGDLWFDERIGLGTSYPAGEENLFLFACHEAGIPIVDVGETLIRHPRIQAATGALGARDFNVIQVQGYLARQLGLLAPVMALRWGSRYLRRGNAWSVVTSLKRGFCSATIAELTKVCDNSVLKPPRGYELLCRPM
jgi:glycosyltransferase involved in cell wall biosynthesis